MSAEGLWTIQFSQAEEEHGGMQVSEEINRGGILVFMNGRIYGGGISYYFVGTYQESDAGISLTINCSRYNDLVSGAFGDLDEARLVFTGRIEGDTMTLHGNLEDAPDMKMNVIAERKAELSST